MNIPGTTRNNSSRNEQAQAVAEAFEFAGSAGDDSFDSAKRATPAMKSRRRR